MTVSDTYLNISQQALADIGTRSKITDLPIPFGNGNDPSQEAYFCGLFLADVRDHLLRAARWNFAKRTNQLPLLKAAPGTNENPFPAAARTSWNRAYPAPPWLYAYGYPGDSLYAHRLLGPSPQTNIQPPIFSGTTNLLTAYPRVPYSKFEVGTDLFDASGNSVALTYGAATVVVAAGGTGYLPGDTVSLPNVQYPFTTIGPPGAPQSITLTVTGISTIGAITAINIESPGSYAATPSNPLSVGATNGLGAGATFTVTWVANSATVPPITKFKVILTNVQNAVLEYTHTNTNPIDYDSEFAAALIAAMAAKLVQPLAGDKALARDKITMANSLILEARVADANEALTVNDHVPDWLRLRGVGGGLGFEDYYFAPYGPLFPSPAPF